MYGRNKGGGVLISYDFEYYLPLSIKEALQLFEDLHKDGKEPYLFFRWNRNYHAWSIKYCDDWGRD